MAATSWPRRPSWPRWLPERAGQAELARVEDPGGVEGVLEGGEDVEGGAEGGTDVATPVQPHPVVVADRPAGGEHRAGDGVPRRPVEGLAVGGLVAGAPGEGEVETGPVDI